MYPAGIADRHHELNRETRRRHGWTAPAASLPIVQFIALRWYFRLFIWGRLLWQISRMDLNLVPSHPDGSCGLRSLGGNALAMGPLLMAHSVLLSGFLANRILYEGTKLPDHRFEIIAVAILLYLVGLGPVCVFAPRLFRQRLHGLYTYGPLASEYVIGFEKKWMGGERPSGEPLVGTAHIQSLADLANSFAVVQHIRPFPFGCCWCAPDKTLRLRGHRDSYLRGAVCDNVREGPGDDLARTNDQARAYVIAPLARHFGERCENLCPAGSRPGKRRQRREKNPW